MDTTRHKEEEDRLRFLLDELNHRTQNTLTTVMGIAAQTLHGAADQTVVAALEGRILALSRAQSLLGRRSWEGAAAPMNEQLPAIIGRTEIIGDARTHIVPALIAAAGERASLRFLEFFAANIRHPHTRRAYSRAIAEFMTWCEDNRVTSITAVQPLHVSAWIEQQTREHAAPTAKLRLAALRHLFNWLVTGQVIPTNPQDRCAALRT